MEPVTWGFIGTLLGAVAGASASILTTLITQKNLRNIKGDEVKFMREEQSRKFQCENLLKVQESIATTMRLIARAHLEDMSHYRNKSAVEPSILSEPLNSEILIAIRELSIFSERIANDGLRKNIKELMTMMNSVLLANSSEESLGAIGELSFAFDDCMVKIGHVLRGIF